MRGVAALIVGGGPAGAAAAIILARAGVGAHLVDRQAGPHDVVCGGFLGWDALAELRALGVDAFALGARPIGRLRLAAGGRQVELALPHRAAGLSRRVLDEALIGLAGEVGAAIMRGRAVRAADAGSRSVRFDDGEEWAADALFLATGKHELRGLSRDLDGRRESPSAGLRAALPADARRSRDLAGMVELHLFDGGYAGLLLQEDGTANLCLSVARERLAGGVTALMTEIMAEAPRLAERMKGEIPAFDAVAGVPYGWRAKATSPGIFRIGDQGAVIASLAGDGIAIALASGGSAAQAYLNGGADAAADWQARMHRRSFRPLAVAEALRHGAAGPFGRGLLMRLLHGMPGLGAQAALLTRISARRTGGRRSGERSAPDPD
ncbi:monooxygenase FAD-binding protein [Sphingobium chlorophenolicum L-1]|uniref:Monooxygenase FAD-binding protein n=1 Tax=Sphingobium chlorophenolicum L-1 TaxID=690566 RepID=F6F280_SPHCR|nr:FAD-dependent monooxygenase [Sphingobium chlorophenolicum]AEG50580.1 monooxygenase FAD-binding protein [Sphingobium chlorophenolicum L-1]